MFHYYNFHINVICDQVIKQMKCILFNPSWVKGGKKRHPKQEMILINKENNQSRVFIFIYIYIYRM